MTSIRTTLKQLGITEWQLRPYANPAISEAPSVSLDTLNQCILHCQRCPLSQTRKQAIFGIGNPKAKLMLIGEQPDAHTDATKLPFTGPVGELLTKMLAAIEQTPDSVYLTTLVKCHPLDNRSPFGNEIAECLPYLQQQIALVQPKVILTMGPLAIQSLLAYKTSLATLRGQTLAFGDTRIPIIASYTPAYLLHNPSDKRGAFQDLLRVAALLKEVPR